VIIPAKNAERLRAPVSARALTKHPNGVRQDRPENAARLLGPRATRQRWTFLERIITEGMAGSSCVGPGRLEQLQANQQRLFGLAYRLLGEATDAEDVVQDAYLRWMNSHDVAVPEAWLTTVVTNLCLNRLTSARACRESYVGPWLPEPVVTGEGALGPLETVDQRESSDPRGGIRWAEWPPSVM
jgi:hypothetical protein